MRPIALAACLLACSTVAVAQAPTPAPAGRPATTPTTAAPPAAGAQAPRGGGPPGARPPRYIDASPVNFADHEGWISMFDGKTLTNWEGPPVWRVEDGSIVTSDRADNPTPNGSVYLLYRGSPNRGDVADFEFKYEIKLEGERANSGIQFRGALLGKTEKRWSEFDTFGYQADMDAGNVQTGALIECCAGSAREGMRPRPFRASMGMALRTAPTDYGVPSIIGSTGDPAALKASINSGGWNQVHIVARGPVLMYFMNGKLMSTVIDDTPGRALTHGYIAVQLEGGGDKKVSYRNLWLKTYK